MKQTFSELPQRILLVKMSSLGDIITALPVLAALRHFLPQAHISWAIHREFQSVLPGKPYLDEVVIVDRTRINSPSYWLELRRQLREKKFDLVLDLQMIAKSALVVALSGASRRYGYWEAREGAGWISRPLSGVNKYGHITERLLDVMRELGLPVERVEYPLATITAERYEVRQTLLNAGWNYPFVIIVPGSRGERKRWTIAQWQQVIEHIIARGVGVVVTGSASEKGVVNKICEPFPDHFVMSLAGKTNLRQLMAWESEACLHISGDTGPLHIANALRTPIVGLYGPTLPERSGPYAHPQASIVVAPQLPDRTPQMRRDDRIDMKKLTVEKVIRVIDKQLDKTNPRG